MNKPVSLLSDMHLHQGRFRNRLKSARKSTQRLVTAARKIAAGAA
ncbi:MULTISPECIES: hypothetical protein [unclassified Mesorhizobium]|nr:MULTISPECIES: hypothetical protein [unclassified Mesorhizobium]